MAYKQKRSIAEISSTLNEIKSILNKARRNALHAINREMLIAYFKVGKKIVEVEQKGEKRAKYGQKLLDFLSKELTREFGRGYSLTALRSMRTFYIIYKNQIRQSVTGEFFKLSWTHYCELIKIDDESKRKYFERYAITENLSVRDLKRQIYSLHYERLLLSGDKNKLKTLEKQNFIPLKIEDAIKDPYILEFLDLDEKYEYTEKEVETKIINDLQKFLLELGQGFSFVGRQRRFTIDNDHFYIDLLFYNIYLRCYVVIDIKIGKFKHEDSGQMNFYLNYVRKNLNKKGDNEPIGIILCTERNKVQVEYSLEGISNKLFVSKYKLYLPTKKELETEVQKLL